MGKRYVTFLDLAGTTASGGVRASSAATGLNEKRLSLFNVSRWKAPDNGFLLHECGVYVVPTLAISEDHAEIERCLRDLSQGGSAAEPGFMHPEGVVVYHTASQNLYKVLIENDDVPKGKVGSGQ